MAGLGLQGAAGAVGGFEGIRKWLADAQALQGITHGNEDRASAIQRQAMLDQRSGETHGLNMERGRQMIDLAAAGEGREVAEAGREAAGRTSQEAMVTQMDAAIDADTSLNGIQKIAAKVAVRKGGSLPANMTAGPKEQERPKLGTFEGYVTGKYGEAPTPDQVIAARQEWARADDRPAAAGGGAERGLSPNQLRQQANELRKGFERDTKTYNDVRVSHRGLESSLGRGDAAGDLAAIFAFMKSLDPGSTVREGEFANAQNAAGVDSRITNWYNQLKSGTRLSPAQRQQFLETSAGILKGHQADYDETVRAYEADADYYKIPKDRIVRRHGEGGGGGAQPPPGGGKTVTRAQLAKLARQKGTNVAAQEARAAANGYSIVD
jgi:hypothetical protein